MPIKRRTDNRRLILRLAILLIGTMIIKYGLAAPDSRTPQVRSSEELEPVVEGSFHAAQSAQSNFTPKEKIPSDKSISFPTDI